MAVTCDDPDKIICYAMKLIQHNILPIWMLTRSQVTRIPFNESICAQSVHESI